MRAYEFLFEDIWSDVVANWVNTGIDLLTVEANVNKFKQLKNKNLIDGIEKDIQFWKNKPFAQFVAFIDANAAKLDATKGAKRAKIKASTDEIVLDDTDKWLVVVPLSKQASQKLGTGTTWCTSTRSDDNRFDIYTSDDLTSMIYIISKTTDEKYAIRFENNTGKVVECRDKDNFDIGAEFQKIIGFTPQRLVTQCMSNKKWQEFIGLIEQRKIEKILQTGDAKGAYFYARDVIKGRWHEGEKLIASDPERAYKYANYVIKGRFPEGEKVIASNSICAYYYATDVIKGRFPEGEKAIASDFLWAYHYAKDIIQGRFLEAENLIASNPEWAYEYAKDAIRGRWPEGEKVIASDPEWAYKYADKVLKGRFPEGEAAIASDPGWAYYYARDIIKGRWPEGETAMTLAPNKSYANRYKHFLKSIGEK